MYNKGDIVLVKPLKPSSSALLNRPDFQLLLIDKINHQNSINESFTGRILDSAMEFLLEYGHPLYRCLDKHQIQELVLPARQAVNQLPHLNIANEKAAQQKLQKMTTTAQFICPIWNPEIIKL